MSSGFIAAIIASITLKRAATLALAPFGVAPSSVSIATMLLCNPCKSSAKIVLVSSGLYVRPGKLAVARNVSIVVGYALIIYPYLYCTECRQFNQGKKGG